MSKKVENEDFDSGTQYRSYLGNSNLKRSGEAVAWTNEMVQEYLRCAKDPIYFAEKYIHIVHVDHGLIPIVLYDYQKEIIQSITESRRVAVNTSRQAGKTTTAVVIILHYALFNDHKTIALLANKGDAAREILSRIQTAFESLPKWLQQGVVEWNKGSVEFENGCKILAGATSSGSIRGKSISFLYIDETAFVEGWDEFFASVFPTISSGNTTKILFTSTPNGLNHFYKTCIGAKEGNNGYRYIEVPWYKVPGRGEEWKRETLEGMDNDTQKFEVEFNCEFMGSSQTLISGQKLKELVPMKPILVGDSLNIYEEPIPDNSYVCVVDVSRGKGLDYSTMQVIDVTKMPYRQVCVFRDNLTPPAEYAQIVFRISKKYNNAATLVENNDIGGQVADMLYMDFEHENLIKTFSAGVSGKRISTSGRGERGVRTTKTVKSVGCSILKLLIEQERLIIKDWETINELSTFSRKGTSYEAEPGCHDDLVMCLVLFAWMSDQKYFKEMTDINTLAELRERSSNEIEEYMTPFGFYDDGLSDFNDFEYGDF